MAIVSLARAEEPQESFRERFERLHAQYATPPDELWRTIPWETDLLAAQRQAVAQNKPIFIWAMDGHPLGCT